jgi:hypothetical protein
MPNKIIVAIHGIGDQVRCETIQLVAHRFAAYCAVKEDIPLGRLNATLIPMAGDVPPIELEVRKEPHGDLDVKLLPAPAAEMGPGAYLVQSPPFTGTLGFAEVYWADIPRGLAKDRYNLEEAKRWATTMVDRVRVLGRTRREEVKAQRAVTPPGEDADKLKRIEENLPTDADYDLAAAVIREIIETIDGLQKLLYWLGKAMLLTFDLEKILVDYLGDVQVVAEFDNYRRKIVDIFHSAMTTIHDGMRRAAKTAWERAAAETDPAAKRKAEEEATAAENAEIYIVAHSEGTVVAFLGILEAISRSSPWVGRLHGLMTIGSPLNKHLLLWPELFENAIPPTANPPQKVKWVNYYDLGDPVGFRLERTREWMGQKGWSRSFDFEDADDVGFTRYYLAGKAHLDYFQDEEVFGHFIQTVVKLRPPDGQDGSAPKQFPDPPGDLRWRAITKSCG